eukprot:3701791-Heterocapsa_arctica.AAC.1
MYIRDVKIGGKCTLVRDYGEVHNGCAFPLFGADARVLITESDLIYAPQVCMEGFQVATLGFVVGETVIFTLAIGNFTIIVFMYMKKMKNNAIVGNIGHFDNEMMVGMEGFVGSKVDNIKLQ